MTRMIDAVGRTTNNNRPYLYIATSDALKADGKITVTAKRIGSNGLPSGPDYTREIAPLAYPTGSTTYEESLNRPAYRGNILGESVGHDGVRRFVRLDRDLNAPWIVYVKANKDVVTRGLVQFETVQSPGNNLQSVGDTINIGDNNRNIWMTYTAPFGLFTQSQYPPSFYALAFGETPIDEMRDTSSDPLSVITRSGARLVATITWGADGLADVSQALTEAVDANQTNIAERLGEDLRPPMEGVGYATFSGEFFDPAAKGEYRMTARELGVENKKVITMGDMEKITVVTGVDPTTTAEIWVAKGTSPNTEPSSTGIYARLPSPIEEASEWVLTKPRLPPLEF